jgi:hypothetical protein
VRCSLPLRGISQKGGYLSGLSRERGAPPRVRGRSLWRGRPENPVFLHFLQHPCGTRPPPPTKYAHMGPESGDPPSNPCPYRRDPEIPPLQAASGKPPKCRPLSCRPGGQYDC